MTTTIISLFVLSKDNYSCYKLLHSLVNFAGYLAMAIAAGFITINLSWFNGPDQFYQV